MQHVLLSCNMVQHVTNVATRACVRRFPPHAARGCARPIAVASARPCAMLREYESTPTAWVSTGKGRAVKHGPTLGGHGHGQNHRLGVSPYGYGHGRAEKSRGRLVSAVSAVPSRKWERPPAYKWERPQRISGSGPSVPGPGFLRTGEPGAGAGMGSPRPVLSAQEFPAGVVPLETP